MYQSRASGYAMRQEGDSRGNNDRKDGDHHQGGIPGGGADGRRPDPRTGREGTRERPRGPPRAPATRQGGPRRVGVLSPSRQPRRDQRIASPIPPGRTEVSASNAT